MTASLHRAEDVASAIRTRVQQCTRAQGAETDLGRQVFQGRKSIDDSMSPCSTILEGMDSVDSRRMNDEQEVTQQYIIFAYVPCDPNDPNIAAHAAIRDMKRALFRDKDGKLGGQVRQVKYIGRDIGPRADGGNSVVAAIEVHVTFVERLSNP